ncbi:MAG: CotH kinase family protein [Paludibacteraceae bacterium]|nr:CotH kinase family protein [Paludibacteraceae bacterium]
MKNFTNNFKQFTSRLSARWLIVNLMLLLGIGEALGAVTYTSDDVLFFNMKGESWWIENSGNGNFAYFFNNSTNKNAWSAHAVKYSGDVYYVKVPAGEWTHVILTRNSVSSGPSWDNVYNHNTNDENKTGDIELKSDKNYISDFAKLSTSVTWSTQKPTSNSSLSASSTNVKTGEYVTLTPSLTSNTTYNEIKSTTYSISPSSGASISGNKFTATAAGTYTITATITYNPRGYSSLTSTVQPTVQITVTSSCTPPILTLSKPSADANKGDDVNLTTLSGATASSGTVEWYTTENSTTATSASVTVSETKTYYARAVGDCKSDAKSFKINAKCTKDFYLVGASADIFGSVWTPAQTANKMNCDLNTLTKTYTNITVAANTTVEYKYTGANEWDDAEYPTSGNTSFTIPTAGKYNITFTAQTDGSTITGTPKVEWELACNDLPNDAYSIKEVNKTAEWTGSNITPIITKSNNNYPNPTVTYNGKPALPKDVGLYTVKATVSGDAIYCDEEFDLGTFTITCPTLTAPTVSVDQHIVKCGTDVTQKGKITISGLVTGNTYTYKVGDNGTAQSLTFTGTSATLSNLETGGKYIVTASNGCDTKSANETVNVTTNTKATLNWSAMPVGRDFLIIGESLTATVTDPNGTVEYESGNTNVIAVEGEKLVAIATGTATVTAKHVTAGTGYCSAANITKQNVPVKYFNVAGTANLCGDAWNTTANPMTYNNGVWSKTFEAKPAAEYQFKVTKEFWPQIAETPIVDNSNADLECTVKRITNSKGETYDNIFFTTPTKGNITIKYTEAKGAYVEFEPICLEDIDIEAVTADKDQYNYNETAKLSIADATIDAAYGSVYSISYQWQEKNGDEHTDIQGATGKTYQAENLEAGNHTYRVAVTYSYTGFDKTCTGTKYSEDKTIEVICPAPDKPTVEVISHTTNCKESTTKGKVWITNYDSECEYYIGNNISTSAVSVEDGKAYIYFELTSSDSYTIRAKRKCGSSTKSEFSDSSDAFTVNYTDNTPSVKVSILGDNSICAGETTTLTANISDLKGTIKSYSWSPEGGIISENTYTTPALNETKSFIVRLEVVNEGCEKTFTATAYPVTVNPIPTVTYILPNVAICKGEAINDDLNFLALPVVTNGVAVWYDSETGGNIITKASLEKPGTYWVAAENAETGCKSPKREKFTTVINELPKYPELGETSASVCQDNAVVDLGKLAKVDAVVWYQNDEEVEKPDQVSIATAGEFKYLAKAVDPNTGCVSAEGVEFPLTVNPLPTITLTADNETVSVSETVTLSVSGSDFTELKWSATDGTKSYTVTPGVNNTATITTDENALITVTVVAKSDAGCETSASIDLTFGSEDCRVSNADYIEILCRRTNDKESATADRDMHCYAWITGTTGTLLGGWPGVKTENVDFEYKGKKYAVWHIKSDAEVSIIFNNNNDDQKTGDIPGHVKGYRYVYTLSSDYKTATLYEEPSLINMPEVRTISVTSERQANGDLKVYMSGKILKKGCAVIKSYGFQYKKDNGDYTGTAGIVENTDKNAGFVFTAETTLTKGNYGEYTFRARLINENSTKVYGEEFKIYFYESDVFIEAVGGDKQVTNKSGVYYDFVGLYVKNVTVPAGVSISRYKWFKGDVEYNAGNATVADRGVSSSSNNIRPNEAGTYTCEVTLSNGDILESNEIEVSATNTYSEVVTSENRNLPVISVRTNEAFPTCETAGTTGAYPSTNIEGWKEKRSVDVKIFNADGTLYYDRKARMNYRGSSSLNFKKKSYAFCPGEENCGQEKDKTPDYVTTTKMNLFGLSDGAKDKDWVLYAAAADPTLMRNRIVFDTYADMTGKWGVDSKYVELVIDGVYQGVYVLMDKITNNEKRVDITDPNGFIVKFDKTDIADREADLLDAGQEVGDEKTFLTKRTGRVGIQTYHTFVDQLFEIEYPEKKKVVKNGGDWSTTLSAIKQKFEEFETALADGDYIKVRSLIDYESWADWFIINEFTKNVDAYRASCVFVYNGNKIEAQPLWDQELSFNNAAGANIGKKGADKTTGLLIENNGVYTDCFPAPFWFTGRTSNFNTCGTDGGESTEGSKIENYLLKDECFVATIKERWKEHTKEDGALHKKQLTDKLALLVKELGAAKDREITKWPSNHRVADACDGPGTGYNDVTFKDSQDALEAWIDQDLVEISSESESASRASNLNYLIENMEGEPLRFDLTLNPASGVTTPWIPITVTVEVPDGYEYTYDDSAIKAHEGVIIKSSTDKHSYTFPRPENWETGNQGEGNEIEPLFYEVNVSLNIETTETASCGESKFETSKTAIISLQDEGDDLCNYAD